MVATLVALSLVIAALAGAALVPKWSLAHIARQPIAAHTIVVPVSRAPRGTLSLAAHDLYMRARDDQFSRSDSGARVAIGYLRLAIDADTAFAAAYAALAHMQVVLGMGEDYVNSPPRDLYPRALAAARRAVALDDASAEAHAELGFAELVAANDLRTAEAELRYAIVLDPADSRGHEYLSKLLSTADRGPEAVIEARRALDADPMSVSASAQFATALLADARYDEALGQLSALRRVVPPVRRVPSLAASVYVKRGMYREAITQLRNVAGVSHGPARLRSLLAYALARAGERDEAEAMLTDLIASWRHGTAGALDVAQAYLGLGERESAFRWLEWSVDDYSLREAITAPIFDDLRKDERFNALRRRILPL